MIDAQKFLQAFIDEGMTEKDADNIIAKPDAIEAFVVEAKWNHNNNIMDLFIASSTAMAADMTKLRQTRNRVARRTGH